VLKQRSRVSISRRTEVRTRGPHGYSSWHAWTCCTVRRTSGVACFIHGAPTDPPQWNAAAPRRLDTEQLYRSFSQSLMHFPMSCHAQQKRQRMLCIQEVSGARYFEWSFLFFLQFLQANASKVLKLATTTSFHILPNSLFTVILPFCAPYKLSSWENVVKWTKNKYFCCSSCPASYPTGTGGGGLLPQW
jgi:hypothetical protein